MGLYDNWIKLAYDASGKSNKRVWDQYIPQETAIYETILGEKITSINGTLGEIAERFHMNPAYVIGFVDGISEAAQEEIDAQELELDSPLSITLDFEQLYKKMVAYKAAHLYNLPQWEGIFSEEQRKVFFQEQKQSGTVTRETPKVGRNDPCPCGSGKKYKHCCGK